MRKTLVRALAGLLLVAPALGCSGDSAADKGGAATAQGELANLPEGMRYPGAAVVRHVLPTGSSADETFFLRTGDGPGAVADFYRKGVGDWRQVHAFDTPQSLTLVYETPDGMRRAWVVIAHEPRDGKTDITVSLAKK
jgi:hypothetical protein